MSDIGNVNYTFSDDGIIGYGRLSDGTIFMFDADLFSRIKDIKWYVSYKSRKGRQIYIVDCHGRPLHQVLFSTRKGMELDHINLDTLDNRRCNVRFCTHQQNQINQPLQKNNTSGVSGVSYYPERNIVQESKSVSWIFILDTTIHFKRQFRQEMLVWSVCLANMEDITTFLPHQYGYEVKL